MGKGFKQGAGGVNPLNFRILGGTAAPADPKENTIWVSTDTPITGWSLGDHRELTGVQEGCLCIYAEASAPDRSERTFNALKKNGLYLDPLSAYQYTAGAWVFRTAQIYRDGAWRDLLDLAPYFFKSSVGWVSDHSVRLLESCTMDTEAIHIPASVGGPRHGILTEGPISLPGATTLHVLLKSEGGGAEASNGFYMGFGPDETVDWPEQYWTAYLLVRDVAADWTEYTLDISGGITDQYFKAFVYYCNAVTVGDIWYS